MEDIKLKTGRADVKQGQQELDYILAEHEKVKHLVDLFTLGLFLVFVMYFIV